MDTDAPERWLDASERGPTPRISRLGSTGPLVHPRIRPLRKGVIEVYTRGLFARRPITFVYFDGRPITFVYLDGRPIAFVYPPKT